MTTENYKPVGLVGLFDDPESLLRAAERVRDAGWKRWDCHTPYPVHGLEKAMGVKESFIPYVTLTAGLGGVVFAKAMQWYMSDFDYPLMIGGKPLFSLPAFIPVSFELFVLFGALATFSCIVLLCRLGKWSSPLHDSGVMADVTGSRYAVVLDASDANYTEEGARGLLEESGCEDIRPLVAEQA